MLYEISFEGCYRETINILKRKNYNNEKLG